MSPTNLFWLGGGFVIKCKLAKRTCIMHIIRRCVFSFSKYAHWRFCATPLRAYVRDFAKSFQNVSMAGPNWDTKPCRDIFEPSRA